MFERFWRRLRNQAGEIVDGHDDRRLYQRQVADLETTCRLVNGMMKAMTVRVRNVSRGGINFSTDVQLEPGTLLRVDLPQGNEGEAAVLACVLHCKLLPDGTYSIGCSFSDELGDSELEELGGRKEQARGPDKRAWMRFPGYGTAEFVLMPPSGEPPRTAEIANISPTGVGLLVEKKVEPGVILDLLLKTKSGEHAFDILACVVFLGQRPEGGWVLGCHFIRELEESDLKNLV
jgi:hypothetical protein